ncbi:hypothetical protein [Escherichia coli]|nr:hypothetical protein [Escherichia coli]
MKTPGPMFAGVGLPESNTRHGDFRSVSGIANYFVLGGDDVRQR